MRTPKGFGKRYFTLQSIQAYSSTLTLERTLYATESLNEIARDRESGVECDDEDDPTLLQQHQTKECDQYFIDRTFCHTPPHTAQKNQNIYHKGSTP